MVARRIAALTALLIVGSCNSRDRSPEQAQLAVDAAAEAGFAQVFIPQPVEAGAALTEAGVPTYTPFVPPAGEEQVGGTSRGGAPNQNPGQRWDAGLGGSGGLAVDDSGVPKDGSTALPLEAGSDSGADSGLDAGVVVEAGPPPPPVCGNEELEQGEQCDDGANTDPEDGCRPDCTFTCTADTDCLDSDPCNGDEWCDDTTHTCKLSSPLNCEDGEACTVDTCVPEMGCSSQIVPTGAVCGDSRICVDGLCSLDVCGDGIVSTVSGEQCDDENAVAGDGCEPETCRYTCEVAADCEDGVCSDHRCVECVTDLHCTGAGASHCANSNCVVCTEDTHCLGVPGAPACASGIGCRECAEDADCSDGKLCQANSCVCVPDHTQSCVGNSLYNFNSCGGLGSLEEECCSGCDNGSCNPVNPTAGTTCVGNDVYFLTSCGDQGARAEICCNGCTGGACNALDPQASVLCSGGNVHYSDSCGDVAALKETCCNGCTGGACDAIDPQAGMACFSGDVYYTDSCGAQAALKEACCNGCTGGVCDALDPQAGTTCFDTDVYWTDSCGDTAAIKEDCSPASCESSACACVFADPALEAAVRAELATPTGPISPAAGASITTLVANAQGITTLDGAECLTGLTELQVVANSITDLTPLAGLTALETLIAGNNSISDLTPLAGLTGISALFVNGNNVTDVTPLAGLTALEYLYVSDNNIVSVAPLQTLTALKYLHLHTNSIVDISALAPLNALLDFQLHNNQIVDISIVSDLAVTTLSLNNNKIVDVSPLSGLTTLSHLLLLQNEIVDLTPLSAMTWVTNVELLDNLITDVDPLLALTGMTNLDLRTNAGIDCVAEAATLSSLLGIVTGNGGTDGVDYRDDCP